MIINLTQKKKVINTAKYIAIPIVLFAFAATVYFLTRNTSTTTSQTPQKQTLNICIETKIPKTTKQLITAKITSLTNDNAEYKTTEIYPDDETANCTVVLRYNMAETDIYTKIWTKLYVPATKYSAKIINIETLKIAETIVSKSYKNFAITWDSDTEKYLSSKYDLGTSTTNQSTESLTKQLQEDSGVIAIIPFDQVDKTLRVLPINNQSPLNKDFNITTYPFTETYWINGTNSNARNAVTTAVKSILGPENYEKNQITDVILTGSSRLGIGAQYTNLTAKNDFTYPLSAIATTLSQADITHMSLENVLFDGCNAATSIAQYICSTSQPLAMFKPAGIDVIELTSEHMLDFKAEKLTATIKLLTDNGYKVFGAGSNATEANAPVIIEKNGIKIAFLGANFEPTWFGVWATAKQAGTAGYNLDDLKARIKEAKAQADFVFVDMQWGAEYSSNIVGYQTEYGHAAIESGADIVTGVHSGEVGQAQYYQNGIIFFSLGNFVSDKNTDTKSREGLVVRHIFYGKKYLGYQLLPIINKADYQIQFADETATTDILDKMFK